MRSWEATRVARAAGAALAESSGAGEPPEGPRRVTIDSRTAGPGELFVGLKGERAEGGRYAAQALQAGAWGVLVAGEHAHAAARAQGAGVVLVHPDPLAGLQSLAREWGRELRAGGTRVVAITGSTGKTSTKDILAAILSSSELPGGWRGGIRRTRGEDAGAGAERMRAVASPENLNTEIGLPLAVLAAPAGTDVLVLEMAMRGAGQIAELAAIAEPDVGVIVNVGPVHLELLGTVEAIAAAKAELLAALAPGASAVVPAGERLLDPYLREDVRTVTFGAGGDVWLERGGAGGDVVIREGSRRIVLEPSFGQAHQLQNLLAAVAAARALGVDPHPRVEVSFSSLRGERIALAGGVVLINDCYNANPMSVRAAIDELAATAPARRVAVLGDMLELGAEASRFHREVGEYATQKQVELLIAVGRQAAEMGRSFAGEVHLVADANGAARLLPTLLRERDTVLVKGSRGVGLERVAQELQGEGGRATGAAALPASARGAGSGRT